MSVYYTMVTEGGKKMDWVKELQKAIDYIEDHITEDIDYAEIAKQAYSFSYILQRCDFQLNDVKSLKTGY